MLRLILVFVAGVLARIAAGQAVLPPGYAEILDITSDAVADNRHPSMNNCGQIVWSHRADPRGGSTAEIFLYDNGIVTQITDDDVSDVFPDINDAGVIVWSRGIGAPDPIGGAPTLEIVALRGGSVKRLTDDGYTDYAPRINNQGAVVWYKWTRGGCANSDADIYLYDCEDVKRITFGGYSHQGPELNGFGDVVWARYNFCHQPWSATIMLRYFDGTVEALTDDSGADRSPSINNARLVAWHGDDPPSYADHVHLWQGGVTTTLTDWGSAPYLNNSGDIAFNRWHEDSQTWQVCLSRRGHVYEPTSGSVWHVTGDIDDSGNIAFLSGDGYTMTTNLHLLKRLPGGDLNCDSSVDAFDIDPFVTALVDETEYQAQYADCDATLADLNLDGSVNAFDIDPFVQVLTRYSNLDRD